MKWFYKIEEWLGCVKRVEYNFTTQNLTVACYVGCGCISGTAEVIIYEYRPNKKIFKEKYLSSKTFWLKDYPTIEEGVFAAVSKILKERQEDFEIQKKWKEFEKSIDKSK